MSKPFGIQDGISFQVAMISFALYCMTTRLFNFEVIFLRRLVLLEEETIKNESNLVYLGSIITDKRKINNDIKAKIGRKKKIFI